MQWEAEKWRKLYRRVDASWLRLPLLARGLGSELLKYADDAGRIAIMADEGTGEAICRIMSAHKSERKSVADLAEKLIADGYLIRETDVILIRNFTRAQCRSSNAERQARYRHRRETGADSDDDGADSAQDSNVTSNAASNAAVTDALPNEVTDRALPLSLLPSGSLSADPREEAPVTARARDSEIRAESGQRALFAEPKRAKRRGAETAYPEGWAPTPDHFRLGLSRGLSEVDVKHEAEKFKSDALARDKRFVRWGHAFTTWLQRTNKPRGGPRSGPTAPDPAKAPFVPVEGPVWSPETP